MLNTALYQSYDMQGIVLKNRVRFLKEVTEAVVAEIGAEQTGVRLSPFIRFKDMDDPEILTTIIATGNMAPKIANRLIDAGQIDLAGFGGKFLANPDYPELVATAAPLNEITDTHTLFGGRNARGYTDYPTLENNKKNNK